MRSSKKKKYLFTSRKCSHSSYFRAAECGKRRGVQVIFGSAQISATGLWNTRIVPEVARCREHLSHRGGGLSSPSWESDSAVWKITSPLTPADSRLTTSHQVNASAWLAESPEEGKTQNLLSHSAASFSSRLGLSPPPPRHYWNKDPPLLSLSPEPVEPSHALDTEQWCGIKPEQSRHQRPVCAGPLLFLKASTLASGLNNKRKWSGAKRSDQNSWHQPQHEFATKTR